MLDVAFSFEVLVQLINEVCEELRGVLLHSHVDLLTKMTIPRGKATCKSFWYRAWVGLAKNTRRAATYEFQKPSGTKN
jgi:hypothetical protein